MSAKWEAADLVTGSVVLASLLLAFVGVVWIAHTPPREHLTPLYTEFSELGGVAARTPVWLNGFRVGRVDSVIPRTDADGRLSFRVRMLVKWKFGAHGAPPYQAGLHARLIAQPKNMARLAILDLETPQSPGTPLAPGATIPGIRDSMTVDSTRSRIDSLTVEIRQTLRDTRGLIITLRQASRYRTLHPWWREIQTWPPLGGHARPLIPRK